MKSRCMFIPLPFTAASSKKAGFFLTIPGNLPDTNKKWTNRRFFCVLQTFLLKSLHFASLKMNGWHFSICKFSNVFFGAIYDQGISSSCETCVSSRKECYFFQSKQTNKKNVEDDIEGGQFKWCAQKSDLFVNNVRHQAAMEKVLKLVKWYQWMNLSIRTSI